MTRRIIIAGAWIFAAGLLLPAGAALAAGITITGLAALLPIRRRP